MSESQTQPAQRSVASLIKTQSISNPDQYLHHRKLELEQWKSYWKQKQEQYFERDFDSNAPSVNEVNAIRKFFNQYLDPKLEEIRHLPAEEKMQILTMLSPFNSEGGISEFMKHFFQLEAKEGKLEYVHRDPFEKEVHILYDIFKMKKTVESIDIMLEAIANPAKDFPSRFPKEEKKQTLEQVKEIIKVLFKYTIKPEYQKELFNSITMEYVQAERLADRREKNMFYSYPHVIEKYDYRNLIFLLYFRKGMMAKVGGEQRELHYNYLNFEIIKQEYLSNWLETRLKKNPAKQKIYETYEVDGKTIAKWIEEDPAKEIELLKQLPISKFNDLIAQVNDVVPAELKTEVPSMSEKHGEVGEFKKQGSKAAALIRAPLDKLKAMFASRRKDGNDPKKADPQEKGEKAEKNKASAEPAAPPPPEPEPDPILKITGQNEKQVPYFCLVQSAAKYGARMQHINTQMGREYALLNKLVNKLMNAFGESGTIRRRTPKHDWVVPYLFQYQTPKKSEDYLMILGGEAKVKPKGMGYSKGDEYIYTAYVIFAAAEANEKWGPSIDERTVSGRNFKEFDVRNAEVRKKVLEFMDLIIKKEFPNGM